MNENAKHNLKLAFRLLKQAKWFKTENKTKLDFDLEKSIESLRYYTRHAKEHYVENTGNFIYRVHGSSLGAYIYDAKDYWADSFIRFLRTGNDEDLKRKREWIYFNGIYYKINDFFLFDNKIYNKNEYYLDNGKLFPLKDSIKISRYGESEEFVPCRDENIRLDDVKNEVNCQNSEQYIEIYPRLDYSVRATSNAVFPFIKYKGKRILVETTKSQWSNYLKVPLRCVKDFTVDTDFSELKNRLKERGGSEASNVYFTYSLSRGLSSSTIGKLFNKCMDDNRNRFMKIIELCKLGKVFNFFAKMQTL